MQKRLYRSRHDRMLGGVSGGIAEHLGIDVTLVRLIWLLLVIFGGGGIVFYIICWIIIPEEPVFTHGKDVRREVTPDEYAEHEKTDAARDDEDGGRKTIGYLLILGGLYFLMRRYFPYFHMAYFWPVVLILLGILLISGVIGGRRHDR